MKECSAIFRVRATKGLREIVFKYGAKKAASRNAILNIALQSCDDFGLNLRVVWNHGLNSIPAAQEQMIRFGAVNPAMCA